MPKSCPATERNTDLRTELREISSQIDERDIAILRALLEHKVLTTDQLSILFFRSLRRCQQRLKDLTDIGLLGSFDPKRDFASGRPPDHRFLTELGTFMLAHRDGVPRGQLPRVPDETYRDNRNLLHRLGVNAFFCALVEASRATDGHCLHRWAPERKVHTRAGEIQPDGFGRYLHPGGACHFYLEYDRGTEGPTALARKLRSYLRFAAGWGEGAPFPNVLVVVPDASREGPVVEALAAAGRGSGRKADVPLSITSERHLASLGVLGEVWRGPGGADQRLRLIELPTVDARPFDRGRCLGRDWTDPGAHARISPLSAAPRFPTGLPRRKE